MYLKSLTALGFKSFADKTTLNFVPGVAAIVGPNGCGKSNISDAIRWVLGEQSAKALRGGEMADVIFNGTDYRKPLGMAEVSLTIGDVDQEHLRAAGVQVDYNEVTVTRRVFRDGGSEYFINKTSCRLKDIQQLFMGTGMGRASYSIMAQGNITQIISSKPDDRRMVFEEAAGITKFKAQKKESLRKLESTDQNLLRVQDTIKEVKRQIGSLQRQAGKARRYKEIITQLQHLDTQLARHQFDVLSADIAAKKEGAEKLRVEAEVCSDSVLRGENEIQQLRERLAELEQQISSTQQHSLELKSQIDRNEHRVHFNEERLKELDAQNTRALADITQGEERQNAAREELEVVTERLAGALTALDAHRDSLNGKKDALLAVERELSAKQDALRKTQADLFAAAQQLARVRNEINTLDLQKQGNVVRLEKLTAEKLQLEEESMRMEQRLLEFESNAEAARQNIAMSRGTVEERQKRLRELQDELNRASQQLDAALRQQAEKRSRLNVLEQLQGDYEGFGAGAVAVLKGAKDIIGSLTDKIRVPDQYVPAVETALGANLQLALASNSDAARRVLADLAAGKKGKASIAALDMLANAVASESVFVVPAAPVTEARKEEYPQISPIAQIGEAAVPAATGDADSSAQAAEEVPQSAALEEGAGISAEAVNQVTPSTPESAVVAPIVDAYAALRRCTPALSVIQADGTVQLLLNRLLGRTFIAPDLETAAAAWKEAGGACDFVTAAGETLSLSGVFSGGAGGNGKTGSSVLLRKNQIEELQQAVAALQEQVAEASRVKGAIQSEQTALQASLQQAQSELRTQEVAVATRQGEFNALNNSKRALQAKFENVSYEATRLAAQEQEGINKRNALATQISDFEDRERALQAQVAEFNATLDILRQNRDQATSSLNETKVAMATDEQLCSSFRQQERALQHRLQEVTHLLQQRRQEVESFITRRAQFEEEIAQSQRDIESLTNDRETVNTQLAALQSEKESQDMDVISREEDLRGQRRRQNELQQQRSALEIELAQKSMGLENIRTRVREKYQLNIDDIRSECITITIADEGPAKVETLTPAEMEAQGAATDWDAVAEQVATMQRRIDDMGPVNLVAIEEYEETEQRYNFLTAQHDDLVKAKEQLLDVLGKINGQTKEMFAETFAKIRDNFRAMFTEVFGGGKADLILTDEADVLESGIEIVARPPGKQLQSITLLSGGEQTMTAVALLFSIYQVKPSPFCVLDELDAPLDESNINRFTRILTRFLSTSQFIIITHNKRTIGMADVLYGVTMEEHGVSKLVSVKFHKADEPAQQQEQQHARPLVPSLPGPTLASEGDKIHKKEDTIEVAMAK